MFERIAREAAGSMGCSLFTVTAFDAAAMQVQRLYSTNPSAYPDGGRKPKRDTEFGRHVLAGRKPLVCEGDDAIAAIFDDHETIFSLGLHASINAPVVSGDNCIGVLNFLMTSASVSNEQLNAACAFASDESVVAALRDTGVR